MLERGRESEDVSRVAGAGEGDTSAAPRSVCRTGDIAGAWDAGMGDAKNAANRAGTGDALCADRAGGDAGGRLAEIVLVLRETFLSLSEDLLACSLGETHWYQGWGASPSRYGVPNVTSLASCV